MTTTTERQVNFDGPHLKTEVFRNLGRNRYFIEIGGVRHEILHVWENQRRGNTTWELEFRGKAIGSLVLIVGGRVNVKVTTTTP